MFHSLLNTFLIITIYVVHSKPTYFLGTPVSEFVKIPETEKLFRKAIEYEFTKRHPDKGPLPDILTAIKHKLNRAFWKLDDVDLQAICTWIGDTEFAEDIRSNWWKGGKVRLKVGTAGVVSALTQNYLSKKMKQGIIYRIEKQKHGKKANKININQFMVDAKQFKGDAGSFKKMYYPPFNPSGELVLFFGLRQSCDNMYVGDPNDILYGPVSTSTDYYSAETFARIGGTIFKVTIPIQGINRIGGILDTIMFSTEEEEWILYDIPLYMISIARTGGKVKKANKADPCFRKGTLMQYKENNKKPKAIQAKKEIFNYYNGFHGYDEYDELDLVLSVWLGTAIFVFAFCIGIAFCVSYHFWQKNE